MTGLKTLYRMATLLDVFATSSAHGFEQDLLHTPVFKKQQYDGLVNGHRGTELFLVDEGHTYDAFFKPLIRRKFDDHKNKVSSTEDRQMRIEEQRLELVRSAMQSTQLQPSQITEIVTSLLRPLPHTGGAATPSETPAYEPFNAHRPTDKRVQQYDKSLELVTVHEGLREAARAVPGGKSSCIRTACVNNALYLGYRWLLVDRDDRSGLPCISIAPTAPPKRRSGRIAQLSLAENGKMRSIVAVHQDQVAAAESVGLASSTSITNAIRFDRAAGRHLWSWFDDLDDVQRRDWAARASTAEACCDRRRGRRVEQLDPVTLAVLKTFPTMSAVCHEMQASHKMLHAATLANSVYKDFRWNVEY
jgi:hypothetical protein